MKIATVAIIPDKVIVPVAGDDLVSFGFSEPMYTVGWLFDTSFMDSLFTSVRFSTAGDTLLVVLIKCALEEDLGVIADVVSSVVLKVDVWTMLLVFLDKVTFGAITVVALIKFLLVVDFFW